MEDFDLTGYTLFERQSKFYNGSHCVYCKGMTNLVDSSVIHMESHGWIYYCQKCGAAVGTINGDTALGTLAKKSLRDMRQEAHKVYDPLWEKRMRLDGTKAKSAKSKAARWLSELLGIHREEARIGYLNLVQCKKLIEECKKFIKTPEQIEAEKKRTQFNIDAVMFNSGLLEFGVHQFNINGVLMELKHHAGNVYQYKPKEQLGKWINGKKWVKVEDIDTFLTEKFKR